jgi:hypothetical protein
MTKAKASKAEALLNAHVQFMLDQLSGKTLQPLIEDLLDHGLADAQKLTLHDAVTRTMIKDTARTFAADLEFGSGIPELVGDVARALYAHPLHEQTTLNDVLSDKLFTEMLDKSLEMASLREKLVHEAIANPLYSAFASDLLYHGIKDYLGENAVTRSIPGAGSMLKLGKAVMNRATPRLEGAIEENLKKYISKSIQTTSKKSAQFFLNHTDSETLREIALDIWEKLKELKISSIRDDISSLDVEEGFVMGYEFWRELRKTNYYRVMIDAGIDAFFEKYGDTRLSELLADIGITREKMLDEALRYAPHVIKVLNKKKLLEPLIRRNLEPFYRSAAVEKILG